MTEQLNEDPLNAWKNRSKTKGAISFSDEEENRADSTPDKVHALDKDGKKVSSFSISKKKELTEMSDGTLTNYKEKAKDKSNTMAFTASRALYNGDKKTHFAATKELINTNKNIGVATKKLEAKTKPVVEVSNELLKRYKTGATAQALELDKNTDKASIDKATSRFKGVVKATNKQFRNDRKCESVEEFLTETPRSKELEREIDFANYGNTSNRPKKTVVDIVNKNTKKVESTHLDFNAANKERTKRFSAETHSLVKRMVEEVQKEHLIENGILLSLSEICEYISETEAVSHVDGRTGTNPISTASAKTERRKNPRHTGLDSVIAKILSKTA